MYVYYDNSLREGPVEVGLFVHGKCFMYRIGPTLYASCENGINRCSTPQLVYIEKIFNSCLCRTTAPTKELQKEHSELTITS